MAAERLITLDTETTGLSAADGDRIIEIGCVALDGRSVAALAPENFLQLYINPEREIPQEVIDIHGITNEFVADKPVFADVAQRFIDFVRGSTLIIHNAAFDTGFINKEFERLKLGKIEEICPRIVDTVRLAKKELPGKAVSLDNLCRHFGIDNSSRTLHGALLDAKLLAEVYLALTRGQDELVMHSTDSGSLPDIPHEGVVLRATGEELAEHERILDVADKKSKSVCAWRRPAEIPGEASRDAAG